MSIGFQPEFLVTPRLCFPHVHDGEPDSVEMSADIHHRVRDMSQDSIERNDISTSPNVMGENDTGPFPQTNLLSEPGEGDVAEERHMVETNFDTKPTAPLTNIEGSRPPSPGFTRPSLAVEPGRPDVVDNVHAPNIVIFGEAGVGKSSVINLIAGQKRAHISNDALGCTFQYQRHMVTLNGIPLALWDTTGLDEGSKGTVPAKLAECNLRALIQKLAQSGGIHLVIYCTRGTRLTRALKHNYDLIYTAVCRKKVHVALVVTGLEHQRGNMETWWDENKAALQRYGMWFDAHACVTTLEVDDAVIRERRSASQRYLRDLVVGYAKQRPWKIEASLISWAVFRNILRGVSSSGRKVTRRVIIYDGVTTCRSYKRLIGDRQLEYEFARVDSPLTPSTSGKSASVLVFYTSPPFGTHILPDDVNALKAFHDAVGGKSCPMIVVLRGCNDDQIAQSCWDAVASDVQACPVVDEPGKLDATIEKLCIEHVEAQTSRFHRAYEVVLEFFAAVLRWEDRFGETLPC